MGSLESGDGPALVLTAPARNYSPWYQGKTRLAATRHEDPLPEEDLDSLPAWKARRRQRLVALLGQVPEPVPLDLETLESVQCDGYRRDKVVFDSEETMSVPAYLLVPDGRVGPGPAVLAVHGHGPGKAEACGLERSGTPHADYAHQLARRGYTVL